MKLKVIQGGEAVPLEVSQEMLGATDEQVLSYVAETLKINTEGMEVDRTPEGILVRPRPTYG